MMARWKARVEFLLRVIELFLSLTVEALQGKTCQNSLLSAGGRSLGAKISGGRGRPWRIFFGFYKTRHILQSNSANCTVVRAVILTQYRRVTDGQTDGIAVASIALAMRALRRAVKRNWRTCMHIQQPFSVTAGKGKGTSIVVRIVGAGANLQFPRQTACK